MDDVENQTSIAKLASYVSSRPAVGAFALMSAPSIPAVSVSAPVVSAWTRAAMATGTAVRPDAAVRGRVAGGVVGTHNDTVVALAKQGAPPRGEPR